MIGCAQGGIPDNFPRLICKKGAVGTITMMSGPKRSHVCVRVPYTEAGNYR